VHDGGRGRVGTALGVTVAAAAVALALAWLVASPWDAAVWPLLAFVPVPAVVWWLVSGAPVARMVVAVTASPRLGAARYGSALDRLEDAAVLLLADAGARSDRCGPPPPVDYGVLGVPDRVCVVVFRLGVQPVAEPVVAGGGGDTGDGRDDTEVRQVRFDWGLRAGVPARQLVFEGAVAQPVADRCVRYLQGRWWSWQLVAGGCPRGSVPSSG
jgi:hypothetical protein